MYTIRLKPSDILYSQDSINNVFHEGSQHRNKMIGETLDDICEGRCRVSDIPRISVMREDDLWITADNRRLWIFQNLERLGLCSFIKVKVLTHIPPEKMTSTLWGRTVRVRRDPGGYWHRKARFSNDRQRSVRVYRPWNHETAWAGQEPYTNNYESFAERTTLCRPESRRSHVVHQNPDIINVWPYLALMCVVAVILFGSSFFSAEKRF